MNTEKLITYLLCSDDWFFQDPSDKLVYSSDLPFQAATELKQLLELDETKAKVIDSLLDDLAIAEQKIERLREALLLCAEHVDWMPHPHCVEVEATIHAALGDTNYRDTTREDYDAIYGCGGQG